MPPFWTEKKKTVKPIKFTRKKAIKFIDEEYIWTFKYPDNGNLQGRTYQFVDKDKVLEIINKFNP